MCQFTSLLTEHFDLFCWARFVFVVAFTVRMMHVFAVLVVLEVMLMEEMVFAFAVLVMHVVVFGV